MNVFVQVLKDLDDVAVMMQSVLYFFRILTYIWFGVIMYSAHHIMLQLTVHNARERFQLGDLVQTTQTNRTNIQHIQRILDTHIILPGSSHRQTISRKQQRSTKHINTFFIQSRHLIHIHITIYTIIQHSYLDTGCGFSICTGATAGFKRTIVSMHCFNVL